MPAESSPQPRRRTRRTPVLRVDVYAPEDGDGAVEVRTTRQPDAEPAKPRTRARTARPKRDAAAEALTAREAELDRREARLTELAAELAEERTRLDELAAAPAPDHEREAALAALEARLLERERLVEEREASAAELERAAAE